MKLVRYADRPDLREIRYETLSRRTFPEFMHHNQSGTRYWRRLYQEHPDFQLALLEGDDLVAELHSVPVSWDGTVGDLPGGWDAVFPRAFDSGAEATALAALAISVLPERQGERLSSRMIEAMCDAGRQRGLRALIAPVRPTLKERATRSFRSSATCSGAARTAAISTPGFGSTSAWAGRSWRRHPSR